MVLVKLKSSSSIAWSILWLISNSLVIKLPVPPGIIPSFGMCFFSAIPEITSFTVPSPPKTITASYSRSWINNYHYFFHCYFLLWTTSDNTFQRFLMLIKLISHITCCYLGILFTYPFLFVEDHHRFYIEWCSRLILFQLIYHLLIVKPESRYFSNHIHFVC